MIHFSLLFFRKFAVSNSNLKYPDLTQLTRATNANVSFRARISSMANFVLAEC